MVVATLAFITFIQNNPGFAAWLIAGLFAVIAALISSFWFMISNRLRDLEETDQSIDDRVSNVEVALGKYEGHVGAGDAKISEIQVALKDHVTKEETIFWKKIEAISDAQRISNEALLQRMAAIEGRFASVEARMPNGELKDMALAIARIEALMPTLKAQADSAIEHVNEHNEEAEDWKRRIVALEAKVTRRR